MAETSPFLESCASFVKARGLNILRVSQSFRGGEIQTLECLPISRCQDMYSVAKTFTMTAIGLLYDRGLIRPDEKICDILREELPESGMDERWRTATVDMALRHRLGLPADFLDIDVDDASDFTDDFLSYLLTYPLAYPPDSEARYSDGAYYVLARVAEKKARLPLEDFLWRNLLSKLRFGELAWSHCPRGHAIGATGLYLHSADMVKLGMVYLNGGLYRGERVLSREWVDLAVKNEYALNRMGSSGAYGKGGMYGQELLVLPGQQRVVAVQAFCDGLDELNGFILGYGEKP